MKQVTTMRTTRLAAAAAALMAVAACGSGTPDASGSATPGQTTAVRFVFDWPTPDFELIPIVIAQEQGFYAANGLDVTVSFPPDTATTIKVLGTGDGDLGLVTTTDMAAAIEANWDGAPAGLAVLIHRDNFRAPQPLREHAHL